AERPVERRHSICETTKARAEGRIRTAATVVHDLDQEMLAGGGDANGRLRRLGELRDVRERLGDDVVRSGLDGLRVAVRRYVERDGDVCALCELLDGGGEPALEPDRMDSPRQLEQLVHGLFELVDSACERLRRRRVLRLVAEGSQREEQRDQMLLSTV